MKLIDADAKEPYMLDGKYAVNVPKRGEWINVRQEGVCSWTGECSCCHDRNDIPPPILAHFCPNCGASMREREGE